MFTICFLLAASIHKIVFVSRINVAGVCVRKCGGLNVGCGHLLITYADACMKMFNRGEWNMVEFFGSIPLSLSEQFNASETCQQGFFRFLAVLAFPFAGSLELSFLTALVTALSASE